MIRRRWLILIGIAAFVWAAIVHAPVATLYGWFAGPNTPLKVDGLDGSLSAGSLSGAMSPGRFAVRDVQWRLEPLWLLALRASFHVESSDPVAVSGRVDFLPWGTNLAGVQLNGSLKALLGAANLAYLPIEGLAGGHLDSLHLRHGVPVSARGEVQIRGLVWALIKPPTQLGDFDAHLTTEDDALVVRIDSPSGPLEAKGEARLQADGAYSWDIPLKARPNADTNTQNLLHTLGAPDAQGYYHAKGAGRLDPGPSAGAAARP